MPTFRVKRPQRVKGDLVFAFRPGARSALGFSSWPNVGHQSEPIPMFPNKLSQAAVCAVDRRQREDVAPRLSAILPRVAELSIHVDEHSSIMSPQYVRRIVVQTAPALFLIPCSDPNCADGGHDISSEVLAALGSKRPAFRGTHICPGWVGSRQCSRTIWYSGEAAYAPS